MPIFAFCRDLAGSAETRGTWFEDHSRYVTSEAARIRVAAPLATEDGAKARGDERIVASGFIFATDDVEEAREIVSGDPYLRHKVWDRVDFYTAPVWFGMWTPEAEQHLALLAAMADGPTLEPLPTGKVYMAFCRGSVGGDAEVSEEARQAHGRYIAHLARRMLLGIQLNNVATIGEGAIAEPWRALYVFQAEDMAEGARFAHEDPFAVQGVWNATLYAAPVAFGSWTSSNGK